MSGEVVTPLAVERRMLDLSRQVDQAHAELVEAEQRYGAAKAGHEIASAHALLRIKRQHAAQGAKATVDERQAEVVLAIEGQITELWAAEAVVRSARANTARLRTLVDLTRSIGTSVRTGFDSA